MIITQNPLFVQKDILARVPISHKEEDPSEAYVLIVIQTGHCHEDVCTRFLFSSKKAVFGFLDDVCYGEWF